MRSHHARRANTRAGAFLAALILAITVAACSSTPAPTPSASPGPVNPPPTQAQVQPSGAPPTAPVPTPPQPAASPPQPCGPGGVFCGPYAWKVRDGVPFTTPLPCGQGGSTCLLMMDIYTPVVRAGGAPGATTGPGTGGTANPVAGGTPGATAAATQPPGGWPLVVALPGGPLPPGARQSLEEFGSVMAMHGVVIMAADWRESPQFGGGYPISFEDVGCAIRYARSVASTYGADPAHVTLAAHSFGGFAGAVVSLSPTPFVPPVGECAASSGSTQPDAYVGIAPISSLQDMSPDLAQSFLGGTRAEAPAAWAASDPLELAAAPDAPHLPITLVVSTSDLAVPPAKITTLADALTANGRPVQVVTVSGPDHTGILIDPHTVAAILAASAAAGGS